jgi:hypothetical protein
MTGESFTHERPRFKAKLDDWTSGAREMVRAAMREATTWSAYQWTVLALLTAIFVLVALSYGGIRSELAALKNERGSAVPDQAAFGAEIDKRISEMQGSLAQSIADVKAGFDAGLAKISAKLDKVQAPKPAAPAPAPAPAGLKPAAKPKPQ